MRERATWQWLTVIFAVLSILLLAGVGSIYLRERSGGLLTSDQLISLKAQLEQSPNNDTLKEQIREADQHLRQQYFTHRIQYRWAGYLLLVALIGLIYTGKRWLDSGIPLPNFEDLKTGIDRNRGMRAVGATGTALFVILIWGALSNGTQLPPADWTPEDAAVDLPEPSSPFTQIWPGFRGDRNIGVAPDGDWPTTWSLALNKGIAWSVEVPREGKSSPVLTRSHVYLTGDEDLVPYVMCFDRIDGNLLWEKTVVSPQGGIDEDFSSDAGLASSTPVSDGTNLYAMFGNGWLAAFDPAGNQLWLRDLGPVDSVYGFASSLLFADSKIIVQLDMGSSEEEASSSLIAINPVDGSVAWHTPRPIPNTWSSPAFVPFGDQDVIVATGEPWTIGYDPVTGAELWRCGGLRGEICPSPAAGNGMVFVANYPSVQMAIELGGQGDISESHMAWSNDLGQPDLISPVSDGERLLQVMSRDIVCFDAMTGEQLWEAETEGYGHASPILAGGRIYLCDSYGMTLVFNWQDGYELIGKGTLDESVDATPAFADNRIYYRTAKHLVCVGEAL